MIYHVWCIVALNTQTSSHKALFFSFGQVQFFFVVFSQLNLIPFHFYSIKMVICPLVTINRSLNILFAKNLLFVCKWMVYYMNLSFFTLSLSSHSAGPLYTTGWMWVGLSVKQRDSGSLLLFIRLFVHINSSLSPLLFLSVLRMTSLTLWFLYHEHLNFFTNKMLIICLFK